MTPRTYKLAALFFLILGVGCSMAAFQMFRTGNSDRWFCLTIAATGLLASGAIRLRARMF